MSKVRRTGSAAEIALRRELFRRGLRYRVDYTVSKQPRRVADIVFTRQKIAVFVEGCFWHGCPEHAAWPRSNAEFWQQKIETNRLRDGDTNERLHRLGWTVLRFWEHVTPSHAVDVVEQRVAAAKSAESPLLQSDPLRVRTSRLQGDADTPALIPSSMWDLVVSFCQR